MNRQRIYLDYAATTPLCAEARDAMNACAETANANASGVYASARRARRLLEEARETTARLLDAAPDEIYFTSGGSESDNWALKGRAFRAGLGSRLLTTAIEHPAVLNTCRFLERCGHPVTLLTPDARGQISPEAVREALTPNTALVSVMWANNEIGTIQPVADIARVAREAGVPFHTDAVQAAGILPVRLHEAGVDLASMSAHKFYGPKGVGLLYLRRGVGLEPLIHGGEQERGLRASTENVIGAVGLAAALEAAGRLREQEAARLTSLRALLCGLLMDGVPGLQLTGDPEARLPGNAHLTLPDIESRALIPLLDLNGVEASAGSACTAGSPTESHVLKAIGLDTARVRGPLRLTLGRGTTEQDVRDAAQIIIQTVHAMRENRHV